jgi:hypothetical protein
VGLSRLAEVKEPVWTTDDEVMSSVSSLRSSLFVQAALTALYGLMRSDVGSWTILTMIVAAGAVFVGAALVPTPEMRIGALVFEGVAVAFGAIGLLVGHFVPATLIAIVVIVLLVSAGAVREFTGTPAPTLSGYGAPVASPFEYPAPSELVGAGSVPEVFQFSAPPAAPAPVEAPAEVVVVPAVSVVPTRAAPTMTILPGRRTS